ncbi:S8 family serine peptidase [Rhizobiaceae bacterium]|nr:S8 family serine peptidase [Rhizobiaceae bacterium]
MIEPDTHLIVLRDTNHAEREREVGRAMARAREEAPAPRRRVIRTRRPSPPLADNHADPFDFDDGFGTFQNESPNEADAPAAPDFTRMGIDEIERSVLPKPAVSFETASAETLREIANDPSVRSVAPRMELALPRAIRDADLSPHEVHLDAQDLASGRERTWGIDAIGAGNTALDGAGVTVAVLDTGIARSHPAFPEPEIEIVRRNFTDGEDHDVNGHGTHCAGTIFGRPVDGLRIGVAPGVTRVLIGKVLGPGQTTAGLIEALNWAHLEGANIVSMSLGFDFPAYRERLVDQGVPSLAATSMALEAYTLNLALFDEWMDMNRVNEDRGKGMLICAASGNESARNADIAYRINTSSPAAARNVLSVGAVAKTDTGVEVASFSNMRPTLVGPGVSIVSASHEGGLVALNGTSMACPHVAGLAALIWQDQSQGRRGATATSVKAQLIDDARVEVFAQDADFSDLGRGLAHLT